MTSPATLRLTPVRGTPAPRRPLWQRLRVACQPREPTAQDRQDALERLLALLETARAGLGTGWAQGRWWTRSPESSRRPPRAAPDASTAPDAGAAGVAGTGPGGRACLVGALVLAGRAHGPDAELSRAVTIVYDALRETRGQPPLDPGPGLPVITSPQARLAEVQALTAWNDTPGRTREQVLGLLDLAISRTIISLAAGPAPALTGAG